jgi:phage terminase small subunit
VLLIASGEIDNDTAGAIAEISQNSTGGIKLKLGKHLGMFVEHHDHTGKDGTIIQTETRTWREVLRSEKS